MPYTKSRRTGSTWLKNKIPKGPKRFLKACFKSDPWSKCWQTVEKWTKIRECNWLNRIKTLFTNCYLSTDTFRKLSNSLKNFLKNYWRITTLINTYKLLIKFSSWKTRWLRNTLTKSLLAWIILAFMSTWFEIVMKRFWILDCQVCSIRGGTSQLCCCIRSCMIPSCILKWKTPGPNTSTKEEITIWRTWNQLVIPSWK